MTTKVIYKFAFVGASCSGKTTLAYEVLAALKREGIKVDGAVNEYRREMVFDLNTIENNEWAQYWMILQRASVEAALAARADVDVIIGDRSVLDSYAHMVLQRSNEHNIPYGLSEFVKQWCHTYTKMYLVSPKEFVSDGLRTVNYRDSVYEYLNSPSCVSRYRLETECPRDEILSDILSIISPLRRK